MKIIQAEGLSFGYVPPSNLRDGIAAAKEAIGEFDGELATRLSAEPDIRLALFPSVTVDRKWLPYYLVWPSSVDLTTLDDRVERRRHSDADFRDAIAAYPRRTLCRNCGEWFRTLRVDPDLPYIGQGELRLRKLRVFPSFRCNRCQVVFTQLVVRLI